MKSKIEQYRLSYNLSPIDKKLFIFTVAFFLVLFATAQTSLDRFNQERLDLNQKGMLVLGSWALANIISSPIFAGRSSGSIRAFHQMNGYWNSVNLVIAGFGYYNAFKGEANGLSLAESILEQQSIEKILLFNAGLDLAYITGGFYLRERAKRGVKNESRLNGFGNALLLQGGFLFAFDLVFYLVQRGHASVLFEHIEGITFHSNGLGLIWRI
ncbi:MAG: hypothetical protein AAF600_20130 [Bacteroidota bacterium]